MKRTLFLSLFLTMGLTTSAFAQDTASGTSTVSATVVKSLSITKDNELSFGSVAQNDSVTVAVSDAEATTFTITGELGKNVTLSYNDLTTLSDGTNTLEFAKDVQQDADNSPATATNLTSGSTVALDATTGLLYVYLGGTVSATVAQVIGAYQSTFTLDANY